MEFASAAYLLLLAPVLVLAALLLRRLGRPRLTTSLAAAGAGILVVLGLAEPQLASTEDVHHMVLVLDQSASMRGPRRYQDDGWHLDELRARLRPSDRIAVVSFGGAPTLARPFQSAGERGSLPEAGRDDGETDIEAGLDTAMALLPPSGHIMLLTDGRQTRGDAVSAAVRASLKGVTLWVCPGGAALPHDAGVEALWATPAPASGTRAPVTATVFAASEGWVSVTFSLGERVFDRRRALFTAGERRKFTVRTPPLEEGLAFLRAAVSAGSGTDPVPANDTMELALRVRGVRRLLYAAPSPETRTFPRVVGSLEGVRCEAVPVFALPRRLDGLKAFDAVALEDGSVSRVDKAQMETLRAFVEDMGGGLLLLGGEGSFGAGGHFDTPLAKLSPLSSDPRKARPLSIVVLIDFSGSMNEAVAGGPTKRELAIEALRPLVERLRKGDTIEVVPFALTPRPDPTLRALGGKGGDGERLIATLSSRRAGGGTSIYAALGYAAAHPPRGAEAVRHVLLYSDGVETVPAGDYGPVLRILREGGVSLSAVVTSPALTPAVETFFRTMTAGGRFYHVRNFRDLRKYVLDDAQRARDLVARTRTSVRVVDKTFADLAPPPVDAYVRTGLKKSQGARLVFDLASDDPLLATWRRGLGTVWAFSSSLNSGWARDWLVTRKGMTSLWSRILSDLTSSRVPDRALSIVERDGWGEVAITLQDEKGYRNLLALRARVLKNLRPSEEFPLVQTGPGRYEGRWRPTGAGHYTVLTEEKGGGLVARGEIVLTGSAELRRLGPDQGFLRHLASQGGVFVKTLGSYRRPNRVAARGAGADLAWVFLGVAVLVFLGYLAVRDRR